jgi:23S rRNA pseudouridine2605 synthase
VRLQKVLAQAGVASRRAAERLITEGRVRVDGRVVRELGVRVDARAEVSVDGRPIAAEPHVYFVLNKPDGVVCSGKANVDERGRPTVLSLLRGVQERVYPVGRLDYHSRGVVILTNDGALADALMHPRNEIVKTYHVKLQGSLAAAELEQLRRGVTLEDGTFTLPAAEVSLIRRTRENTWIQIALRQGLSRQLRRMGDAIGRPVLKLIRVAIGEVTGDGLSEGEYRPLTASEVERLRLAARRESRVRGLARGRGAG